MASRSPIGAIVVVGLVIGGLALAFAFGRMSGLYAPVVTSSSSQTGSPIQPLDPQLMEDAAGQGSRLQELEKHVKELKKETKELKTDKADLQNKLSMAADTVNKLQLSLHEANRRAEDAEWKLKISPPSTALP